MSGAVSPAVTGADCLTCGACCCNPPENRAEDYRAYIDVTAHDRARCAIYALRPQGCRRVEPGSALCLRYRLALPGARYSTG